MFDIEGWDADHEKWPMDTRCFVHGFHSYSEIDSGWLKRARVHGADVEGARHDGSLTGYLVIYGSARRLPLCRKHFDAALGREQNHPIYSKLFSF